VGSIPIHDKSVLDTTLMREKKVLVNGFLRVRLVSTTNKIDRCDIIEKTWC